MQAEPQREGELTVAGRLVRYRLMARLGWKMMVSDRLKLAGTVAGVVFAVVLAVQQLSILFGLLHKNTMFVERAGADIWVASPGTELLQAGPLLSQGTLERARVDEDVTLAAPLVIGGGTIKKPAGGGEPLTLVGTELPHLLGGPWNVVAGSAEALREPDTILVEDSQREKFGGLNLGSTREVNGQRVHVGGFVWGLLPFGPPYTFAEIDVARRLTSTPDGRYHYVLVRLRDGADPVAVAGRLERSLPDAKVMTTQAFSKSITSYLLREQLGISFGTSTSFGLIIGFVIVALSMFSSVLDNLREFGTLKAIGCKNRDLVMLLLAQSVGYALIGSFVGLGIVTQMAGGLRAAELTVVIPDVLFALTPAVMLVICVLASVLALLRIRKLEPGMVFR